MNVFIFFKKIARLLTYMGLVGIVGLFAVLFSRSRNDHKIILNPLGHADSVYADVPSGDSGDSGDSADTSDSADSASDTTM